MRHFEMGHAHEMSRQLGKALPLATGRRLGKRHHPFAMGLEI
jgi:hypothetical protein